MKSPKFIAGTRINGSLSALNSVDQLNVQIGIGQFWFFALIVY
jgi:hypothetical protein